MYLSNQIKMQTAWSKLTEKVCIIVIFVFLKAIVNLHTHSNKMKTLPQQAKDRKKSIGGKLTETKEKTASDSAD